MTAGLLLTAGARAERFLKNVLHIETALLATQSGDPEELARKFTGLGYKLKDDAAFKRQALVALQLWANNYSQPIRLMLEFRNRLVHGAPSTDEEIDEVTNASETVIRAMERRLRRTGALAS